MASVTIHASTASGQTVRQLADIMALRMQYLGETARQSTAAVAIDALKSIRASTAIAKVRPIKIKAEAQIVPGFKDGKRHLACLRMKGTRAIWKPGAKSKKCYIVATSPAAARQAAKKRETKRLAKWKGLAKTAIGQMMHKAYNKPVPPTPGTSTQARAKASTLVRKTEAVNEKAGQYSLTLTDNLMYALLAIYGGKGGVDDSLKRAMNKIVATINRKLPDGETFFGPQKIPTPFPELSSRRK